MISRLFGWKTPVATPIHSPAPVVVDHDDTPFAFPCVRLPQAESVTRAIAARNCFSSRGEQEEILRMAGLAQLAYLGPGNLEAFTRVNEMFPRGLILLPAATDLPTGLFVQAFRHGDEIIFAVRGTELTKDKATMAMNLVADMGIGRHKSNEDLISSVQKVRCHVNSAHEFAIPDGVMAAIATTVDHRVVGHTDGERQSSFAGRVAKDMGKGALVGAKIGSAFGTVLACGLAACTGVGIPLALAAGGLSLLTASSGGAAVSAVPSVLGAYATGVDGYGTLLSYIKAIDQYVISLQESRYIKKSDEIIFTGHSLGGYLAGLLGHLHGDKIFAYNGPGVSRTDVTETIRNLVLSGYLREGERKLRTDVEYKCYSMNGDFIGNLGARMGSLGEAQGSVVGIDFPGAIYEGPLDHHGIDAMIAVMQRARILSLARGVVTTPFESARFVVVTDTKRVSQLYPPKGVLLLTDKV